MLPSAVLLRSLAPHVSRVALWAGAFVALSTCAPSPPFVALAATLAVSAALFFSLFSLFHDAAHGSLLLPPRVNDALLALLSAPLFMSTHAQRQLHMRHHARPLAADDVEGAGAKLSFTGALLWSPVLAGENVAAGVRIVPRKLRALVLLEWAAVAALAAFAVAHPTSTVALFVLVAATLQLFASLWASHIPHHPPRLVQAVARRLVRFRSPVVLSLLFHNEHHARPRLPCALLDASVV
jgi:fatty acid desaturase